MNSRRISMGDIVLGQPLPWDVYEGNGRLLLTKGFILERKQQVEVLVERGLFVEADSKTDKVKCAEVKERPSAFRLIKQINQRLGRLLFQLPEEEGAEGKILEVVKTITFAADVNRDVALACILLNQEGNYAVRHCIDTATVTLLVARALQKQPAEIQSLMAAALTMNLTMLQLQQGLQSQKRCLTEAESEQIKRHPAETVALLQKCGVTDSNWLSCVLDHHENEDGSGYPNGKKGSDISENAKILIIADRYCARVSTRDYRKSLLPNAAMRDILLADKKNIDAGLATHFIRELGIYPTGTFVRMEDGEIGVVTGKGTSTTTPVVHALVGPRGVPLSYAIRRDTTLPLHAVREVLYGEQAAIHVNMEQLWGEDAKP